MNELRKHKTSITGDFAFREITFFKRMKVSEIGTILEFKWTGIHRIELKRHTYSSLWNLIGFHAVFFQSPGH